MTELRDRLQTALGDAYTIERELGGGGMSHVFLATERQLDRQVVIKLLPPDLSGGVSLERFHREIQLVARLQNPHIVQIFEVGEANGSSFEMPDSSLWTLYQRLRSDGAPLSMRKVNERSQIFPVFHDLFQRRRNQEKAAP